MASVYVHFPYCLAKCPYCDFVSYKAARDDIDHEGYADAVVAELAARADDYLAAIAGEASPRVASVFFGGGTPSLWDPTALGRVLRAVRERLAVADDAEITVECNPTSLDGARAKALRDVGVNRLSIGTQSLDAKELEFLGRLHDPKGALAAIDAALAVDGLRVSADLIFGLPDQPPATALAHATALIDRGLAHVSAYQLTIEPGTQFGELARRGRLPLADDGRVAEAFLALDERFTAAGFRHYEISNYARPGHEARHNLAYWHGDPYLGLGCAAYGTYGGVRRRNPTDPTSYVAFAHALGAAPDAGDGAAPAGSDADGRRAETREPLDGETQLKERIMLGLRLEAGFDLEAAARSLAVDPWPTSRKRAAKSLVERGRLAVDGPRLRIPRANWLFADDTAARLF